MNPLNESLRLFWREQIGTGLASVALPLKIAPSTLFRYRSKQLHFQLSEDVSERLFKVTKKAPLLVYAGLLGAAQILLRKYADADRIALASPTHMASPSPQAPNLVLVVSEIHPTLHFQELLVRNRGLLKEAYAQQTVPIDQALHAAGLLMQDGRSPWTEIVLALEGLHHPAPESSSLLVVQFQVQAARIAGTATYNSARMERDTVERLIAQLETTLINALEQPRRALGTLKVRSSAEQMSGSYTCEKVSSISRVDHALHVIDAFEHVATQHTQTLAIAYGDGALSYGQLLSLALSFESRLRDAGVGPGHVVAIWGRRHPATLVAILATLRAGAACLPIDPSLPEERIRFMLKESGAGVAVDAEEIANRGDLADVASWVPADIHPTTIAHPAAAGQRHSSASSSAAYILYTSGSTGTPKGVCMPHRSLSNLVAWQRAASRASLGTRTLQFASLGFDVAFQEIFATLCSGGTLVLMSEQARRDPAMLLRTLQQQSVERLFLPFVALQELAVAASKAGCVTACLKEIITAGEQLYITPEVFDLFRLLEHAELHNHYGPTETHVVTAYTLSGPPGRWPRRPPIGKPIQGAHLYLLDRDGEIAPTGAKAELYVGGICLADGYVSQPELTSERFVQKDCGEGPMRLYRTGDVVQQNVDGNLAFIERRDRQVKVRGYRFEPAELELQLSDCPLVEQAAVVVRNGGRNSSDNQILAFVIPSQSPPQIAEVLEFLRTRVPEYMLPARVLPIVAFPRTASGKIDRQALLTRLPELDAARVFVPPAGKAEETIAAIWREVLGRDDFGRRDSFFDLGGNSLLAMRVVSRLCDAFSAEVAVRSILDHPTIETLAATLSPSGKHT